MIHHLPPEVVIGIFHFLYMDDVVPRKLKGDSSHKILKLMLVCKSFNHIIQSTPAFWTRLWLVRTQQNTQKEEAGWIEWIRKHITNSGELPLRIFLVLSAPSLTKIFPILLPTSPRWVHLTITPLSVFPQLSSTRGSLQQLFDAPIPQLLSLSVEGFGKCVDAMTGLTTVFRHAPRLMELEWHDRSVVFRSDDGETGAAEENVYRRSMQPITYHFAQETLEVLYIKGSAIPTTFECMIMHRLRVLSLSGIYRPSHFLERWQLPVLEELHISTNPYDEVTGPVTPEFPILKRIQWLDTQSNPTPPDPLGSNFLLLRILAGAPELQAFSISSRIPNVDAYLNVRRMNRQATDRISPFLAVDDATGAPKYCPNLRELCVLEAGFEELEQLADIRPQLEKVEVVGLRCDGAFPSLEADLVRLEKVKKRMEVRFNQWVWPFPSEDT